MITRSLKLLACTSALLAFSAGTALADVDLGRPGQIRPVPGAVGGNPNSPNPFATTATGLFYCSVSWATVANIPGGYAIGNCAFNWHLYRTMKSDYVSTPPAGYYDGGYIDGDYNGCGWIYSSWDTLSYDRTNTGCADPSQSTSLFLGTVNCSSGCQDGTPLDNPAQCQEYANFRPWSSSPQPLDPLDLVPAHARLSDGTTLRLAWRYITLHASANGTGQYVMVHDWSKNDGQGNWVFVPRSCTGL